MFIPHTAVSQDALRGIVEEFVSREGTEYGPSMHSLESKVQGVMKQLASGQACVVFDPVSETCDIVIKGSLRYRQLLEATASQSED